MSEVTSEVCAGCTRRFSRYSLKLYAPGGKWTINTAWFCPRCIRRGEVATNWVEVK